MSDQAMLVVGIIIAGILISPSSGLKAIANRLKDFTDAYQRRTDWLAEQAKARAKDALQRKQEKNKERERHNWSALWEKLQQLQAEYLELESRFDGKDDRQLKHAHRLAARIAMLWASFLWLPEEITDTLEGYPWLSSKRDEHQHTIVLDYIERYAAAAGITLPNGPRSELGWLKKVAEALDQRLLDLNTPTSQSAKHTE